MIEQHLSIKSVAKILDLKEVTIREYTRKGILPFTQPNRKILIPESAVNRFIDDGRVEMSVRDILDEDKEGTNNKTP